MFIVECFLFFLREAGVDVPTVLTPRSDRRGGAGHARVVCHPSQRVCAGWKQQTNNVKAHRGFYVAVV